MQKTRELKLFSNEWSVPYGLLGVFALLMGALSYLVHAFAPAYSALFTNVMFVAILLLLSIFYRKLYITKVTVAMQEDVLKVCYHKLLFPVNREIPLSSVRYVGLGTTQAIKGIFQVPQKEWILVEMKGKKLFFYGTDDVKNIHGLYQDILRSNSDIVVRENIFR